MSQEGVIKFELVFKQASPLPAAGLDEINRWRDWLVERSLIGRDPARYGGYGFGNISFRLPPFDAPPCERPFVISGTQTGGIARLSPAHYVLVTACFPSRNRVVAEGPIEPSSEAMTHGMLYALDGALGAVMHVHHTGLWRHACDLGIPITDENVPYGSPEMAAEVERLFRVTDVRERRIFSMGGHEDGLVAFGATPDEAAGALETYLEAFHCTRSAFESASLA